MAPAVATISGFLIPDGDSFPSTIAHSSPVPAPINVESDLVPNPSVSSASGPRMAGSSVVPSSAITASLASATQSPIGGGKSEPFAPAAVITGIVLAVLLIIGVIFFFVRRHFIRRRASKVTPARARASQVAISGPIDFQHVSTADGNAPLWKNNDKVSMNVGTAQLNPHGQPDPSTMNKQKYTVNFGKLDSGLHDHVQTMQFARNPRQDSF